LDFGVILRKMIRHNSVSMNDVPVNCLDISRARNELDWQPLISLKEGIARTWDWLKTC
jgi:nucleoside-diphosphate-sugar epimerase